MVIVNFWGELVQISAYSPVWPKCQTGQAAERSNHPQISQNFRDLTLGTVH